MTLLPNRVVKRDWNSLIRYEKDPLPKPFALLEDQLQP